MSGRQAETLLSVEGLGKTYALNQGLLATLAGIGRKDLHALTDVSFSVMRGETLGVVGESGCGKSTMGLALLQLVPPIRGSVRFDGREITGLPPEENRQLRRHMQLVLQNPYLALNPRLRVGEIIAEPLRNFGIGNRRARRQRVGELLERVGLQPQHISRFPHEFSGGQRQRIGIARALALNPAFVVADEPVSALDVSVQAQILNLLLELKEAYDLTFLFISHDLSVVRYISDRIMVMYLGRLMELGSAEAVCDRPRHPYTQALMAAVPELDPRRKRERRPLPGGVPSPVDPPSGCPFHTRCPLAEDRCRAEIPAVRTLDDGRAVACHFA